ncbi:MAG: hotdog domain-containing protein, partial [Deltaproteobacteria bacterium]|nr:hotdog domain-containing protein [Deltaproteobacteria bacterium]
TLLGINKFKFRRSLRPGEKVEMECKMERQRSNVWRFSVAAFEEDHHVAEGELVISVQDRASTF